MASDTVNQSVDDGIPLDFLTEMRVGMDCLPVDDEEAKRILAEKQARSAESLQRFNEAWNMQPMVPPEITRRMVVLPHSNPVPTTFRRPSTMALDQHLYQPAHSHTSQIRDPRLRMAATTITAGPSGLQTPQEIRVVSRETLGAKDLLGEHQPALTVSAPPPEERKASRVATAANVGTARAATDRRHPPSPGTDGEEDTVEVMDEDEPERRSRGRTGGQARSRGQRSRRYSRSRSRSPPAHRRRRKRSRSRSRHRSRSRSSSRSSDRSIRRSRGSDSAMMKSMMAMTMQMINQAMATRAPLLAVPPLLVGGDATQPGMPPAAYNGAATPVDNRMDAADTISVASLAPSEQPEEESQPKYDVSTELFLEGKLSFNDFLALKPSSRVDQIAPVNAKVTKRVNEAISILDSSETKRHAARFLYVPPTYYGEKRQPDGNPRSPLIWNESNVLFGVSSHSQQDVKRCEPFGNVNAKLKDLITKLGLDEGVISQQLEQLTLPAATATGAVPGSAAATTAATSTTARIQAITTVAAKPGTARVRHLIERAAQTDGYACGECIARQQKTYISTFAQTVAPPGSVCRDTGVQTSGPPVPAPGTISLDGLNANQIETVEAIVRFIRARQLAGSIESVQYALRNDRVASTGMSSTVQQNAQKLLGQVRAEQYRGGAAIPPPSSIGGTGGGGSSSAHFANFQLQIHQHQQPLVTTPHYERQQQQHQQKHPAGMSSDPRVVVARKGAGGAPRSFHTAATNSTGGHILPACFEPPQPMSKKAKKKAKQQQNQQHHHWHK
uniref:Uncharacterized protein n=1 Tax=Anopheles dirus TaxID=7168 RepID=A0A182N4E4_9DIPT